MKILRYQTSDIPPETVQPLTGDSFFASPGFLSLWARRGGRSIYWVAQDDSGIKALLPGVEFGRGPFRRFHAMPDGCYAQMHCASTNGADNEVVASLMTQTIARAGYVKAHIFDFHSSLSNVLGFDTQEFTTSIVDIDCENWMPPDKTLQSELRKAERENVSIQPFNAANHLDKFITLMQQTEQRHGRKPKYSKKFFTDLAALAQDDQRVIWLWCEHEGKAVTSHINFVEGGMVLNWQVYYDKAFSPLKANQFMLYKMAKDQAARGVRRLNLGASPPDADTLADYKSKWGGRPYSYKCYYRKSGLGKFV